MSSVTQVAAAVIAEDVQRHGVGDRVGKARLRWGWLIPVVAFLLLGGGGVGYGLAQAHVGPFAPEKNLRAPGADTALSISPITATFEKPTTFYKVTVTNSSGKPLLYRWSNDNPCGTFSSSLDQPMATWRHPHSNPVVPGTCPEEGTFHPGLISVTVLDGFHFCTAMYPAGSAAGQRGDKPECGVTG
jgi:hypothetical protein